VAVADFLAYSEDGVAIYSVRRLDWGRQGAKVRDSFVSKDVTPPGGAVSDSASGRRLNRLKIGDFPFVRVRQELGQRSYVNWK